MVHTFLSNCPHSLAHSSIHLGVFGTLFDSQELSEGPGDLVGSLEKASCGKLLVVQQGRARHLVAAMRIEFGEKDFSRSSGKRKVRS